MARTITLNVEARYGYSGQYIARITGRSPKVHFAREFVGSKHGKRSECTAYETDEIGLYEECDVDKRGKAKSYVLVLPWNDGLRKVYADSSDALAIAKRLDEGERLEDIVTLALGDAITTTEKYYGCCVCSRELAIGELRCPDHPESNTSSLSRQVPKVNPDTGRPVHELVYRIQSKAEARKADAAKTLDTAVAEIINVLAALPEPLQRKAIAAVKATLFPKAEVIAS